MEKILIVDDSPLQAAQLKSILDADYDVTVAVTAEEGLSHASSGDYSLILLDVVMPGMDGLETASILKAEHPEVKIIMLSSLAYNDTFKEAERIGAEAFVSKPLDPNELLAAIETALAN